MSPDPVDGLLWFVVFIVSVTAHEAAHAYAALLGGDRTAYHGGQVTLNPIPHIKREPFGMLILPLLFAFSSGYALGWASTPYDPVWEQRHPRRAAWMAAAGPAANLVLAVITFVLLQQGLSSGLFVLPDVPSFSSLATAPDATMAALGKLLSIALLLNVILFVFNLIPVPPLDGATAITLVMPEAAALRLRVLLRTPMLSLALFVGVFFFLGPWLIGPVLREVVGLLYRSI